MRPGLTLLCITRDEAPKLMRMLKSVQGVVDDIVVFDTGSKDLSPGVARLHGARVFQIDWPGSFSDAINEAMKEVQTEWTLRLDTDEWLIEGTGADIRRLMERPEALGYLFLRRDYSDENHWSEGWALRMWRTDPGLKFQGYIHEHLTAEAMRHELGRRQLIQVPIPFNHDGYIGGVPESKHRRNVEMLRKELQARPGQLYFEVELAMTLIVLGDPEGKPMANGIADRVLGSNEKPEPIAANILGTALTHVEPANVNSNRTTRLIDKSWEWFDACPPLLWAVAQMEHRRGNLPGLYRALVRLEELGTTGKYEKEWSFDSKILSDHLWPTLAEVAEALGHKEVAERNRSRLQPA